MNALSIALKDMQILFKDRGVVLQLFLLPLVFIVVASGALGAMGSEEAQDVRVPLPVVDLDGGEAARALLTAVDAAGGVQVERYGQDQAAALLEENDISRVLTIPAGFGAAVRESRPLTLRLVNHPDANPEQTEAIRLVIEGVAQDMTLETQILTALMQMGEMQANAPAEFQQAFSVDRMQAQARDQFVRAEAEPLVTVRQRVPAPAGGEEEQEINTTAVAVPGFAVLFVFLTAQTTALSIFEEKKAGSFRRLLASPISRASLLAGKMLPNLLTGVIQMAVILAFGVVGLRLLGLPAVSLGNDPLALVLVVLLIALCSSTLGIVIAALARTENQVGGMSALFLWIMAVVGGSIIPLFALEQFLGPVTRIVPHYWANRALDNLMIRGADLAGVTSEIAGLLVFTALFFVIGLWRFDFE